MLSLFTVVSVVASLLQVSRGQPPAACNYVVPQDEIYGLAYAVGVCRNYVDSGSTTSRRYLCNDAQQIEDEVYEEADCAGTLNSTVAVTTSDFRCGAIGECSFISSRLPCADSGGTAATTYSIQPILTETCYESGPIAFEVQCVTFELALEASTCPHSFGTGTGQTFPSVQLAQGVCDDGIGGFEPVGTACESIVTTAAPTTGRPTTAFPTVNPTTARPTTAFPTTVPTTVTPTTDAPTTVVDDSGAKQIYLCLAVASAITALYFVF